MRVDRNGLRPVAINVHGKVCNGYFHGFGHEGSFEEGIGLYAVIELEDGTVKQVDACAVKFEDSKPKTNQDLAEHVSTYARITPEDMLIILEGIENGYNLNDNPIYAISSRDYCISRLEKFVGELGIQLYDNNGNPLY